MSQKQRRGPLYLPVTGHARTPGMTADTDTGHPHRYRRLLPCRTKSESRQPGKGGGAW